MRGGISYCTTASDISRRQRQHLVAMRGTRRSHRRGGLASAIFANPRKLVFTCLGIVLLVAATSTVIMFWGLRSPSHATSDGAHGRTARQAGAAAVRNSGFHLPTNRGTTRSAGGGASKASGVDVTATGVPDHSTATGARTPLGGAHKSADPPARGLPRSRTGRHECPDERPANLEGKRTFFHDPRHKTNFGLTAKILKERGWTQVFDYCDADQIFFNSMQRTPWYDIKEWQSANHLRRESKIADKGNLALYLERAEADGRVDASAFWPRSYHQGNKDDQKKLKAIFQGEEPNTVPWVVKKPGVHLGQGVTIVATQAEYDHIRRTGKTKSDICVVGCGHSIVQRYIANPLLLPPYQRKFDLRVYWFVASQDPLRVYYHDGTTRSSLVSYDPDNVEDKAMFLTNVAQQKKSKEAYAEHKEELRLTFDSLAEILAGMYPDTANPMDIIRAKICHALATVFIAAYDDLMELAHVPTFSLLGADFLIDTNLDVWLLEVQDGPMRSMETPATEALWHRLSNEQWDILEEIEKYKLAGEEVPHDLKAVREFVMILDDAGEVPFRSPALA